MAFLIAFLFSFRDDDIEGVLNAEINLEVVMWAKNIILLEKYDILVLIKKSMIFYTNR